MLIAIVEIIFLKINKGSYNNGLEGGKYFKTCI